MSTAIALITRHDFAVSVTEDARERKAEAKAVLSMVRQVNSAATQKAAVEAIAISKSLRSEIEKQRQELTAPILKLQRDLKAMADTFCADLAEAEDAVDGMVVEYQTEMRERDRRIEEARQRELDAEQRRLDTELARKIAASPVPVDMEAERKKQQEALEEKSASFGPPVVAATADGQSVREEWDYEVLDLWALYQAFANRFVKAEERRREIKEYINSADCRRDAKNVPVMPGLRIKRVVRNQVRAPGARKAIDV